jgi:hypothetical protein
MSTTQQDNLQKAKARHLFGSFLNTGKRPGDE